MFELVDGFFGFVAGCTLSPHLCSSEHRLARGNQAAGCSQLGAYIATCLTVAAQTAEASIKRMEMVSAENSHASDKQCGWAKRKTLLS